MHTYRLVYEDDRFGAAKWVEFEAKDANGAFRIAAEEARGRWAQLFEDGRFVCRLERADPEGGNIWRVAHRRAPEDDGPSEIRDNARPPKAAAIQSADRQEA